MNIISALIWLRGSESKVIFAIRGIFYFFLRLIPKDTVVPVLMGKLKGKSGCSAPGFRPSGWVIYEYEKQVLFSRIIREGTVVYDIGAHAGFHTLLASSLVGPKGKVFSFEPSARNIEYLRRHLKINRCDNVAVLEAAVAEGEGSAFLEEGQEYAVGLVGRLCAQGSLKVKTVSLDSLVLSGKIPPPQYMKIDVEGAELRVLRGARKTLDTYSPVIFLSTHGFDVHNQCRDFLIALNYSLEPMGGIRDIASRMEIFAFRKPEDVRDSRNI